MNINDTTIKNMGDLSAFLHKTAALDISQLGSEWKEFSELLERHAKFIDTYTIPSMAEEPAYKSGGRVAEFMQERWVAPLVVPERPDLENKSDEVSTSFLPTGNGR